MLLLQRGFDLSLFGQRSARLIRPGWISPRLDFARAQAGGAMATHYDGTQWREDTADTPRFGPALKIEGQRTNSVRNPRGSGVVAGSPGTLPTYWSDGNTAGLTRTIVGSGTEFGLPYIEIRVAGTTNSQTFTFLTESAATAAQGDVHTASFFARVVGGTTTNLAGARCVLFSLNSGSSILQTYAGSTTAISSSLSTHSVTSSAFPDATTAFARQRIDLVFTGVSGQAVDITVRFYTPWMEKASFASTPILPAVGAPAASTRGADLLSAPLARLGIRDSGACTVLWSGSVSGGLVGNRRLFCVHDGAFTNSAAALVTTNSLVAIRTTGGSSANSSSAGTVSLDTPFAAGAVINGAGRVACSLNGGSVQAVTGAPISGLATMQIGSWLGAEALFGDVPYLDYLPYAVSDAQLQALVAAMPLT